MDQRKLLNELIKAYRREGYKIFHVIEGKNGIGILIYKDSGLDPDALIHITNEGWAYYLNLGDRLYKYCYCPLKIEDVKALISEILS